MISTWQKIAIARLAWRVVMAGRRVTGLPPVARIRRKRINWELDLREGIDFAIWLLAVWERQTSVACRRLISEGDTVFDIGANIGAHTLPLADAVGESGTVYAFEPTDFAFQRLQRNVSLNADLEPRITTVQAMLVADKTRRMDNIYASWPLDGVPQPETHPVHLGVAKPATGATVALLDDMVSDIGLNRIDLIKMDVDGYEIDVLAGAKNTLKLIRPKIVMELAPYLLQERGCATDSTLRLLADWGYQFHDLAGRRHDDDMTSLISKIPFGASINVLALPIG